MFMTQIQITHEPNLYELFQSLEVADGSIIDVAFLST